MKKTEFKEKIRIGTLVKANGAPEYIRQILQYGFESFGLTFWQTAEGTNWKDLAKRVEDSLGDSGVVISSLGFFGNPLEHDDGAKTAQKGLRQCIDNAHLFGCNIVAGFTGRLRGEPIDKCMKRFEQVWTPLAKRAADKGVRIAFENCDMGGTWRSGDWNIAHNPTAWEMMFSAIPCDNLGLEWEPCHQMVSLIDPMAQLRKWAPKVFHVHGKDASVYWDVVREYGVHGPKQFCHHRTPGFGDSNWADIISELRKVKFEGSIDIEGWHDPVYRGELEMTGQVRALKYLKHCRGGSFVANPV